MERRPSFWLPLLFLTLFASTRALAFVSLPEYSGIEPTDPKSFDDITKIDSEYQSDVLSFQKPISWHYDWLNSNRYFDFTLGSLGAKNFLTDHRLKMQAPLTEKFEFKLIYWDQADFEDQSQAVTLELGYLLTEKFRMALFGRPYYYKSENDLGISLEYLWQKNQVTKIYWSFQDFDRNERNESDDYHLTTPQNFGLIHRWWGENSQEFFDFHLSRQAPSKWVFPSSNVTYENAKFYAGLLSRWSPKLFNYINLNLEYLDDFESQSLASPSENQSLRRTTFWSQWERSYSRQLSSLLGLQFVERKWNNSNGHLRSTVDYLPHVSVKYDAWQVGYEMTWHRDSYKQDGFTEHRLNAIYAWVFEKQAELRMQLTFDLDELTTGAPWEGGNGQFRYFF